MAVTTWCGIASRITATGSRSDGAALGATSTLDYTAPPVWATFGAASVGDCGALGPEPAVAAPSPAGDPSGLSGQEHPRRDRSEQNEPSHAHVPDPPSAGT